MIGIDCHLLSTYLLHLTSLYEDTMLSIATRRSRIIDSFIIVYKSPCYYSLHSMHHIFAGFLYTFCLLLSSLKSRPTKLSPTYREFHSLVNTEIPSLKLVLYVIPRYRRGGHSLVG